MATERVSEWITTFDTVFPNQVNPLGTLFGGRVLELMDINAAIACWRFCRLPSVTASTEPIDFRAPIFVGEIIELRSRVAYVGRTSMIVRCEVYGENPSSGERRLCTVGHLNFVALGEDKRPAPVPPLRVETALERQHYASAERVQGRHRGAAQTAARGRLGHHKAPPQRRKSLSEWVWFSPSYK